MGMDVISSVGAGIAWEQLVKFIPLSSHGVALARKQLLGDQDFCDCAAAYTSPAAEEGETALTLLERATTRYKFRAWLVALKSFNDWEQMCSVLEVLPMWYGEESELLSKKTAEYGYLVHESEYYPVFDEDDLLSEDEIVLRFSFNSVFRRALTRKGRELEALLGTSLCSYHEADYS